VVEEGLHAGAEGGVVIVDWDQVSGRAAWPGTADSGEDRRDDMVVDSMSGSTHSRLLLATLKDFGSRIDTVYSLTNMGVHDDVAQAEVDTCVMQTYLLAGEIL
jgi:hypothetical protein